MIIISQEDEIDIRLLKTVTETGDGVTAEYNSLKEACNKAVDNLVETF